MRHSKKYVCCIHLFMDLLQKRFLFNLLSIYCCTERLVHHYFLLLRYLTFWCIRSFWTSHALNILKVFLSVCHECALGNHAESLPSSKHLFTNTSEAADFSGLLLSLLPSFPRNCKPLECSEQLHFPRNCITSTHQAKELGMSVLLHTITSSLPISVLRSNV